MRSRKYHVKNKYTDEDLWVGSECYEHIINNVEGTLGLRYMPEEAKHFDDFKENNSSIIEFMDNHPSEQAQFVIPNFIVNEENAVEKEIKNYIKRYVVQGVYNKDRYRSIYLGINKVNRLIDGFVNKANNVNNLSRKWRQTIQKLQNNGNSVINRIAQNNGIIDSETAKHIRIKPFLNQYVEDAENKWNDLSLSVTDIGEITIDVKFFKNFFNLSIPSKVVIDKLGYPMNLNQMSNSWDLLNVLTYTESPVINDSQTKANLQLLALYSLENSNYDEYKIIRSDFLKYVLKREETLTNKTRVSKKDFGYLTSQFKLYKVNDLFVRFTSSELQKIGMQILESRKLSISGTQIARMTLYSKSSVLSSLYHELQFLGV